MERAGGVWNASVSSTIGIYSGGRLVAGFVFFSYNGANVYGAMAGDTASNWLSRSTARFVMQYIFLQLGCRRVTAVIAASNTSSLRAARFLGLQHECLMSDAMPDGNAIQLVSHRATNPWLTEDQRHDRKL